MGSFKMVHFDQPAGLQPSPKAYGARTSVFWQENRISGTQRRVSTIVPVAENEEMILTDAQYQAFQEAFELFDKNGGGTIDAAELQKTLDDCGIYVNGDDLVEIMLSLDHDGNGEVDFDEFLNLMTNTDVFLEVLNTDSNDDTEAKLEARKRVGLFDALTEFLKKQALKGANEIIGYYSKKYKTVHHYGTGQKGAHVVGHYADVARLVGLTENELYTQLKELKRHANLNQEELSSPYAQSFHLGLLKSIEQDRRRKPPVKPVGLGGPKPKKTKLPAIQKMNSRMKGRLSESENRRASIGIGSDGLPNGRVTLRVVGLDRMTLTQPGRQSPVMCLNYGAINQEIAQRSRFSQMRDRRKSLGAVLTKHEVDVPIPHRPGWSSQRIKMVDLDIRIVPGWSKVPLSALSDLKAITRFAQTSYFTKVACEKLASNLKFYRSLNTRKPPSNHLLVRVKDCMISYSAATTDNAVGRVGAESLNRVFTADDSRARTRKKSIIDIRSKRQHFGSTLGRFSTIYDC